MSHICLLTQFSPHVYLRVSCAPLTPSAGSRAFLPSPVRRPHCCSISGSCWTRASSTSTSLWSCADPCSSRAANNCWRNGWKRTRYVRGKMVGVTGEMVISTHPPEPLPLRLSLCVKCREQAVLTFFYRMPLYLRLRQDSCLSENRLSLCVWMLSKMFVFMM